ncbi:MAG: homoserine kinase [bacterium]
MAGYTQLQRSTLEKLAGLYGLTVADFEPIAGGNANSSYLLYTKQGKYVLTVFEEKALAEVVRIGQLLLLLAKHNFPTSRLLPAANGDITSLHKGKPVMLKTYIDGQVYEYLDEAMLRQAGEAMARLHQVPAPDFLPDKHAYSTHIFPRVIGRNGHPEYKSWLVKKLAYLEQNIPPGLPCGLIHGDLFYDNVLFEGTKLQAIIDFEETCRDDKVFDLGMGIVGLCAEGETLALEKARALVAGYQKVRALDALEKQTLQLVVEYAATATSGWRFWKYHIDSPTAEKADRHWQMVRLANGVAAIPKARFLEGVFA